MGAKEVSLDSQPTLPVICLRIEVLQIRTLSFAELLERTLDVEDRKLLDFLHMRRQFEKKALTVNPILPECSLERGQRAMPWKPFKVLLGTHTK